MFSLVLQFTALGCLSCWVWVLQFGIFGFRFRLSFTMPGEVWNLRVSEYWGQDRHCFDTLPWPFRDRRDLHHNSIAA